MDCGAELARPLQGRDMGVPDPGVPSRCSVTPGYSHTSPSGKKTLPCLAYEKGPNARLPLLAGATTSANSATKVASGRQGTLVRNAVNLLPGERAISKKAGPGQCVTPGLRFCSGRLPGARERVALAAIDLLVGDVLLVDLLEELGGPLSGLVLVTACAEGLSVALALGRITQRGKVHA